MAFGRRQPQRYQWFELDWSTSQWRFWDISSWVDSWMLGTMCWQHLWETRQSLLPFWQLVLFWWLSRSIWFAYSKCITDSKCCLQSQLLAVSRHGWRSTTPRLRQLKLIEPITHRRLLCSLDFDFSYLYQDHLGLQISLSLTQQWHCIFRPRSF